MIRLFKITALLIATICFFCSPALAKDRVHTQVQVIYASTDSDQIDSRLSSLTSQLKSGLRYTSYKLVTSQTMNLKFNQKGRVALPENKTLIIIPLRMKGKNLYYQINVRKKRRSTFQQEFQLMNNTSFTFGAPQFKHKNGVLLFNIKGSVR